MKAIDRIHMTRTWDASCLLALLPLGYAPLISLHPSDITNEVIK